MYIGDQTVKPVTRIRYRRLKPLHNAGFMLLLCFTTLINYVQADLSYNIIEEQPAGTVVGKINECVGYSCSFDGNLAYFTIDSGLIKSTAKIDREILTTNPIVLNVRSSNPNINPPKVQIFVNDINDNVPSFPSLYSSLQIAETTTTGVVYPINKATDNDFGNNGTVDYSIISGNINGRFTLGIGQQNCQGSSELCIITNKTLDREKVPFYQLKIEASDRGMPPLIGYCLVNITILDANDNAPVFTSAVFKGSIPENTKAATSILTVRATDKDTGLNSEIEYSIEKDADNSDETFQIESNTGVIKTKSQLDYEDRNFYKFTVIASDKGQPKESSTAIVTVDVVDVNDNAPYFKPVIYYPYSNAKAVVSEDCVVGTLLAIIRVSDNDKSIPNNVINLAFSKGNEHGFFLVQEHPSLPGAYALKVAKSLDREVAVNYNLTLNATDQGFPSKSTIAYAVVEVLDVNDNAPKFYSNLYTASISELAPNGSYVLKMNATDPDAGNNGTMSYSITGGNDRGWFQIDSQSGLVTTVTSMDREAIATVSLTITVQDHGTTPKTGTTTLKVTILDENDNAPKFSKSVYTASIPEDSTRDKVIITLIATDKDIDDNAKISYDIDSNSQELLKHFTLEKSSGILKLKDTVDREVKSSYSIPVIAVDSGKPTLSSKATVVITITDINDNSPVFYPVVYFVSVVENDKPGPIVTVTATDKDFGSNGKVIYSIKSGNENNSFAINDNTGEISTVKSLDHEVNGFHKLEITAQDGGGNSASAPAFVEVTVVNQADNPPYFAHAIYNFSVYENAPKGTLVGKVFAKTKDKNDTIMYEITSGDPGHLFIVDSSGGIIMVNGVIDREQQERFWLDIIAKIGITRPLSAKTSVNISILDRNDNVPQFATAIVNADISGSWLPGKVISNVAATDKDAGSNGVIRYQLTNNPNGLFAINTTSGVVTLARKVTDSDDPQYTVQVMASDLGSPPLHGTMTIRAKILINHPPKFRSNTYVTHVLASRPLSYRFLIVNAVDSDSGKDGEISYSIDPLGNQEGLFGIFPDGFLYVKKNLIHATKGSYNIKVRATDSGTPQLSSTVTVTIYIQDSDEHRSLFTNNTFRFTIVENLRPGSPVGTVTAQATDIAKTKDIIYSLVSSDNVFAIDAKSGLITTRQSLDREGLIKESGDNDYVMRAEAVYNDTTVRRDSAIVIVTVSDVNDNPPLFSSVLYNVKVSEKLVPVAVVYQVKAVDPDSSKNANFTYSVVKGSGKDVFHISSTTGDLYLDKPLDRETQDSYNLTLQATDVLNSSLFTQAVVQITVEDYNDERPVFQSFSSSISVSESLAIGSEIIDLNATDKDIGQNGQILYSITCGNLEAVFDINHSTGKVFLNKHLDYETTKKYHLCFKAQDRGSPSLSSSTNLTINVVDANDNAPVFALEPQNLRILENVTVNTVIGRCLATDRDSGSYGQVVYSLQKLVPKGNAFSVDPLTCAITIVAKVDREEMSRNFYQLVVKATDKATPSSQALSATKEIIIFVQDVNDNKPRFVSPPAAHVGTSTFIMNVKAEDFDEGANGVVTYNFITSGQPTNNLFFLNSNTGQLDKISQLSDNNLYYKRLIKAQDGGSPSLSDQTEITLFKTGGSGPVFTNATFYGSITENSGAGLTIVRVQARYTTSQSNAKIKYYLTSDNSKGALTVNEVSGDVVTKQQIDRESLGSVLNLVIYAVDMEGPSPSTSSTNVAITVRDVNDNAPEFSSNHYTVHVDEDISIGSTITTLTAKDSDQGDNARVTYTITGSNHGNMFKIDSNTGKITNIKLFDRETLSTYTINVTARDHGKPSQSSSCLVSIKIDDVNDNTPTFNKGYYSFKISEDALIGTTVGVVKASDVDDGANAKLTYSILGPDKDIFSINSATGVITLSQRLDRETVEHYVLNVTAKDNGKSIQYLTSVSVYVTVLDTNDNSPEFDQNKYQGSITEGDNTYTHVISVVTVDKDAGTNGLINYSIISGNTDNSFAILKNGTIVNLKVLDREKQSDYILTVQASDEAMPLSSQRQSTTQVYINVTDINDNKPYFTSSSVAHVSEDAKVGDVVLTVIAVDEDQGSNSQLTYSLTKIDLGAPFTLGTTDGVLRVDGGLDRENKQNYTLKVTVSDKGSPKLSSDMNIVIVIDDYNDHAPVFRSHASEVRIFENVSVGADVITLSAVDRDSGINAEVRYEIVTGNDNRTFSINDITGRIRTAKTLDRETTPKYLLEIRAYDLGTPRKSSVTTVTVLLRDINDNRPVFTKETYEVNVLEDVIDSKIVTVVAQDNDEGQGGDVTYSILDGAVGGVFVINSLTGAIGITAKLDRERNDSYKLTVQAQDGGNPSLSGQSQVVVKVLDKNDNPPVFQPDKLSAQVPEGAAVGTFVVQVKATDKDKGINADLTYSLVNNYARFKINSKTGRIETDKVLDRELIAFHSLEVIARDAGNPTLQGKCIVNVVVKDSNDHDPEFESSLIKATVQKNASPGTIFTVITATDKDSGVNAESDYTIVSGNSGGVFHIAKSTGVMYVSKPVPANPTTYTLQIKAANRNAPQRVATATVQIYVSGSSFPSFLHSEQSLSVSELTATGSKLITVNATGHTAYYIAGGDVEDAFDVDAVYGIVKIKKSLDYEKYKNYSIVIGAKDGSTPPHIGFTIIHVNVLDENDNSPIFSQHVYHADIKEGQQANTPVITITALDADSGSNAQIKYSIILTNGEVVPFKISPSSGEILTTSVLDREATPSYTLKVRAENIGNVSFASEAVVMVMVTDVNDNPPKFVSGFSKANVKENAPIGTVVSVIKAEDVDSIQDSSLRYDITSQSNKDRVFVIDPHNGTISTAKSLDREAKSMYRLNITVSDSKHMTASILNITILDINDNPPWFPPKIYATRISESSPVNSIVLNVTALDLDIGVNAEIEYTIASKQAVSFFSIDTRLGVITVNKPLRFITSNAQPNPNIYNLTIRAENVYSPHLKSDTHVEVEVLDSNDHAPVFKQSLYRFTAVVDSSNGLTIGKILAEDKYDYGPNAGIQYEVSSGNGSSKFRVVPENGEIRVNGDLRNDAHKIYCLDVKAKDLGTPSQEAMAQVCVDVTPKNLHSPKFSLAVYRKTANEDQAVGSVILTVAATDDDSGKNGEITYTITSGNGERFFGIGQTNGSIYIAKHLDYEDRPEYVLNVAATDAGVPPKSSTVPAEITLLDVNDNNPVFEPSSYNCELPENTAPRSQVICTVRAVDKDKQGKQDVRYYIASGDDAAKFRLDDVTGEIEAVAEFDFEKTSKTTLVIGAKDIGLAPQRFADPRADVFVSITGKNEFVPVFTKDIFKGTVAENAPIGHTVLTVAATDKDAGVDGIVVYHLLGADNYKGFTLNSQTGVLTISGNLDSAKHGNVTLQVIAKNLLQTDVTPDNIGHATIIVVVTDANDAPKFLQSTYNVEMSEDVTSGTYVTNVTAIDDDQEKLAKGVPIRYGISAGNTNQAFTIDQLTGVIKTVGVLDRESVPVYKLTVTATDNGSPPMTGNATVVVKLRDVNDNAPTLVEGDRVASVLENQDVGTTVITLRATDRDIDPNRGPYTFQIAGSNYGKFILDKTTGLLKTTAVLDREVQAQYNLSIRITDSGSLSAVSFCLVTVKDQNDNRPKSTPRVVMVNAYDKRFTGGAVADIRPDDADVDDAMLCSLISSTCNMFSFPRGDCMLYSSAKTGDSLCVLKINGSDGIGSVRYNVTVTFTGYTSVTVKDSVAIRLQKTTPREFLSTSYHSFSQVVLRILPNEYSSIQIASIKGFDQGYVDVLVAARQPNTFTYLSKDKLSELLKMNKNSINTEGKVDIYKVDYTPCIDSSPCKNGAECSSEIGATGNTFVVNTVPIVFVSADFNWKYSCRCKPGFTGSTCDVNINDCDRNPCTNGGTCQEDGASFKCNCPQGYTGKLCQTDINECNSNPCKHSTGCTNTDGSYVCQCKTGYTGKNCESEIDYCQGSPCMYNSTCVAQPSSFKCVCDFGGRGNRCQFSSFGFSEVSFMKFKTLRSSNQESYNNITLSFSTSRTEGLLFYNNDGTVKEDGDFIALEIVQGKIKFSYNLGYTKTPAVVVVDRSVSDGTWHHVNVIRDKVTAQVVVDHKYKKTGSVGGQFTQLELNSSPLYIGGVQDFDQVLNDQRKHVQVYDFIGCVRDFYVNGDQLSYKDAIQTSHTLDHCPHKDFCGNNPCKNNGRCKDTWFGYYCECTDGFSGNNCEKDVPSAVRFSATSPLVLQFKESYRREQKLTEHQNNPSVRSRRSASQADESFGISFRTLKGGLVLLVQDNTKDYTVIQVTSKTVHYQSWSSNITRNITIAGSSFIDGTWHNVTLRRKEKTVTLTVDNVKKDVTFTEAPHRFLGPDVVTWSLGGASSPPKGVNVINFNGCMERLQINDINVPLNGANGYVQAKQQGGGVTEGCGQKNGACLSSPCVTNADKPACIEDWYGYTCVSNLPCTPNPCLNNGTCIPKQDGSFTCICHANYSGATCHLCHGEPCVTAGSRKADSPFSIGIIAGILFLVFVIVGIIVGILAVKRHQRLKRESDYDTKHCDDICIPAGDLQDGSHRASPSHSSDDSGVVIRNPSQKSNPDLRISPNDDNKNIVIHKIGAPEDYKLKLHKSDEKIDHGFSESDVGEFVIKNDFALRNGSRERLERVILPRQLDIQHHSTPIEQQTIQRSAPRQRPRPRDRRGPPSSLARQVLDKRHHGPPRIRPYGGRHKQRTNSIDTTSSDEQHDFSDGGPKSEMDNSEMLDYYDIEVASIAVSEASYQYEPSMFKDSMARRDLPAFSQSEIDRIRQQSSSRNPPSGSFLDAISTSSDEDPTVNDKLSSLIEQDDTSSESSNDSFTCSEFEFDERPTTRTEELDSHGSMIFSRLANADTTPRQPGSRTVSHSTVNMSDDDLIIPNKFAQRPQVNGTSENFDWDHVLNWGLRYNNLRGVYKDIAELKDGLQDNGEQYV